MSFRMYIPETAIEKARNPRIASRTNGGSLNLRVKMSPAKRTRFFVHCGMRMDSTRYRIIGPASCG
jgi:hypothetical protein